MQSRRYGTPFRSWSPNSQPTRWSMGTVASTSRWTEPTMPWSSRSAIAVAAHPCCIRQGPLSRTGVVCGSWMRCLTRGGSPLPAVMGRPYGSGCRCPLPSRILHPSKQRQRPRPTPRHGRTRCPPAARRRGRSPRGQRPAGPSLDVADRDGSCGEGHGQLAASFATGRLGSRSCPMQHPSLGPWTPTRIGPSTPSKW